MPTLSRLVSRAPRYLTLRTYFYANPYTGRTQLKTYLKVKQFFLLALVLALLPQLVYAGIEWQNLRELNLKHKALDVTASFDGKLIFTLTPGAILVYSAADDKFIDQIAVDASYSRIAYSNDQRLILAASDPATLSIIKFNQVYDLNIVNRPSIGAENPKVTLVVFDDYQ